MDHGNRGRKFSRRGSHRTAMLMNLVKALVRSERITTTLPKAKDLRPLAEKVITLAKRGDLHARKQVISFMRGNCDEVNKLFTTIADKVKHRNGGYLRIMKAGFRQGDNAPVAIIEFVDN
jgi:large subunit ribosomal protein L17